jgi:predicted component of type VI protein secretion system
LLTESSNTPNFFELELTISPHANYMGVAFSIGLVGKLEREVGSPPVPS